jgi:CheY-like chemotaxis protein
MTESDGNKAYTALVVDDQESSRNFTKTALTRNNMNVELAEDGQIALDMCTEKLYDIIFMDIEMPKLNGYECTAAIRALDNQSRDTYIIAVSGHADTTEQAMKCLKAGMNDIMMKPFSLNVLREKLSKWQVKMGG